MKKIVLPIITSKDLFSILLKGYIFALIPIMFFIAILSYFGLAPMNFNNHPYCGFWGFIIASLYVPFFGCSFAALNFVFLSFGLWLYRKITSISFLNRSRKG